MPPTKKGEAEEVPEYKKGAARFARVKNSLKMGLVGLPNVGKSSTFNLLCGMQVAAENFPFCTIEPETSRCMLDDPRWRKLCDMWSPKKETPAWLHVTDIAGLVKGASEGAGLGNAFLSNIQGVDGMFHVLRSFDDDEIVHVDDSVDPVRDLDTIQEELCKKDLIFWQAAMDAEDQAIKKNPKMKLSPCFKETMAKIKEYLDNNISPGTQDWTEPQVGVIVDKCKALITLKPTTYIVNLSKKDFCRKKNKYLKKIKTWIDEHGGGQMIIFSVEFEEEYAAIEDEAEKKAFLEEAGRPSMLPKMIRSGYDSLALQSFFTCGPDEVRAWTVQAGSTAPQAAGVIHTDFEKTFVMAEIVGWEDYDTLQKTKNSLDAVKAAGKWRQEGKKYVMNDGDITMFKTGAGRKK